MDSMTRLPWLASFPLSDRKRGGKATSGNGQAWIRQVLEGSGEQKMEENGCEVKCGV